MKSQTGRMRSQHKEELNSYPAGVEAGRQECKQAAALSVWCVLAELGAGWQGAHG